MLFSEGFPQESLRQGASGNPGVQTDVDTVLVGRTKQSATCETSTKRTKCSVCWPHTDYVGDGHIIQRACRKGTLVRCRVTDHSFVDHAFVERIKRNPQILREALFYRFSIKCILEIFQSSLLILFFSEDSVLP